MNNVFLGHLIWKTGDDHITIFHDGSGIPLVDEKINFELWTVYSNFIKV